MTRPAIDRERLAGTVEAIAAEIAAGEDWGEASGFIPELAGVDTRQFGMAVLTREGDMVTGGDADTRFSIQSVSKVFSLKLALDAFGPNVWDRVGREPSGDPYNSIVDLERHEGLPRNPFINAGALVVVDMLLERAGGSDTRDFIAGLVEGEEIGVDEAVARSEQGASYTNRALANLAKAFDNFHNEVDDVLSAYIRQCAVALSCRQLARAGRFLMLDGFDAVSRPAGEAARRARRINALMLTCGQYDGAGDFAFRVGLPAKSGIGGGILAIVPGRASVAVWSPGLDANGNSLNGTLALQRLSEGMDWSVFGAGAPG